MGGWVTWTITDNVRAGARRTRLRRHGSGSAAGGTRRSDRTGSGGAWLADARDYVQVGTGAWDGVETLSQ